MCMVNLEHGRTGIWTWSWTWKTGNITLTLEHLAAIMNEHVAAAIRAAKGAQNQNPLGNLFSNYNIDLITIQTSFPLSNSKLCIYKSSVQLL